MAVLRLFAGAREAAGSGRHELEGETVGDVLDEAVVVFGPSFADILPTCRIWVDGEPGERDTPVNDATEVAVLPPVSGGAR